MKTRHYYLCAVIFFSTGISTTAATSEKENLFQITDVSLDQDLSTGVDFQNESHLRDDDESSHISVKASKNNPAELVFYFAGKTVSPDKLKFKITGIDADKAQIEVLASTLSSSTGFTSLRTEPIRKTDHWQEFSFEQSAAKWIMIKLIPFTEDVEFSIAELNLRGHIGPPVTLYKFNESPADAIAVLSTITALSQSQNSVDISITADEASLFADAADGKLDDWSFAEASLLSSGVQDAEDRKTYLDQIDLLEAAAMQSIPTDADSFEKGRALLGWLHSTSFNAGYIKDQTDVSLVLKNKTYNCVSSATLYNILARRMGLDIRGIEVPDHAFSILYDGTKHVDIETTTNMGFNPARNRAGLTEFAEKTGFVYITDKHRSKRREINDAGMVALTYYNHGVELTEQKNYHQALLNYFRALSLDPHNNSAVKNALSVLSNWSVELLDKEDFDGAIAILDTGLTLAPDDRTLLHNTKVAWQKKAEKSLNNGDISQALASLKTAFEKTQDKNFLRMQSWLYQKQGEQEIEKQNWDAALALAEEGLRAVDVNAKKDMQRWRTSIIIRWANHEIEQKNFAQAINILEPGLYYEKIDYKVKNNLAFAAQEWTAHVSETEGADASREIAIALSKRFPDLRGVQKAASRSFDIEAQEAANAGDFQKAVHLYAKAREQRPDDNLLKQNERATWNMWADQFMKKSEWAAALDVYEKAHIAHPSASLFKQNINYVVQEWSRQVAQSKGALAAENLIASIASRFPDISAISRTSGNILGHEISEATKAKQYEDAAQLLFDGKEYFKSSSKYNDLTVYVYYNWAEQAVNSKEWQDAIEIYEKGYKVHSGNSKLKRNLVASWHAWAETYMHNKEWNKAIEIYQQGLISVPNTSLFKQNIKYCEAQR